MAVRKHIIFSGQVQGVGFRYQSFNIAKQLGLTGWVKNLWDGRVEMEVQGAEKTIMELVERLKTTRFIEIEGTEMKDIPLVQESDFRLKNY